MDKNFFYEIIKYKPLLFKKMISEFYTVYNKAQMDDKYKGVDFLFKNSQIKNFLHSRHTDFSWDYTQEEKRLSLLTKNELEELAFTLGLCVHSKEIVHTVLKEEVLSLKSELGEEFYLFTLERGQFRLNQLATLFKDADTHLPLIERVKLHGQICIQEIAVFWSDEEKEKLPNLTNAQSNVITNISEKQKQMILFAVKKILINDITSEWKQCLD